MRNKKLIYLLGIVPLILFVAYISGAAVDSTQGGGLTAAQAQGLIVEHKNDADFIILDVRTPAEFARGHIPGAKLLDFYDPGFKNALGNLDKSKTYLIYCRSGNRSGKTLDIATKQGFTRVYHIERGLIEWQSKGYRLVRQ